jgi:nitrite reductase/ring-hydroxylating ferredoxin subunit/uncharacterized membrane protein
MARFLTRLMAANDRWAKPLGDALHDVVAAIFRPIRPVKDLLHGTWLGHPLHAATTDLPIGILLVALVLEGIGEYGAADVASGLTIVLMVASAVSGLADYSDTDGTARTRATTHAVLMVAALLLLVVAAVLRLGDGADRMVPFGLGIVAFALVSAGAYVGGDVVYVLGNMVSRHAFRGPGTKWIRLDLGEGTDLADLPEATPTKARAGINDLVLVRLGGTVHALHDTCAHAGGPLSKGTVTADGCIECPWHASRFRLADGGLRQGPSVYDQPAYEIRAAEGGGYEVRRRPSPEARAAS